MIITSQATKRVGVNVTYITTFHQCIYYGSNKHFGYNYFIYAIYVPILYIL